MSTNIRRSSRRAAVKGTTNANLEESMTISHLEVSPTHYLLDVDSQCIQRIIPIWIRIVPIHAPPIYRYQSLVGNFIKNQHICTVTRISIEIDNTCTRYLFFCCSFLLTALVCIHSVCISLIFLFYRKSTRRY